MDAKLSKFYPILKQTFNQFETIRFNKFVLVYTQFKELLDEALLYKDDVISKSNHERLQAHLSTLNAYEIPLKKLELYLTVNEDERKLILRNQFNQIL